jgi:hypothetical protein
MLSSQMLCPRLWRISVALMVSACSGHSYIQHIACQGRLVAKLAREEDLFRATDKDLIT